MARRRKDTRGARGGHELPGPHAVPETFLDDPDRHGAVVVRTQGADQSYVVLDDPEHLEFDYVQRIAAVIDAVFPRPDRIRVVHLGGAGLTLPRWVAATRPTSAQTVCEPDAALVAHVRAHLPLPPRSGIKIRTVDARTGLPGFPAGLADVVILDAFADGRVPADVATTEAFAAMTRLLAPHGLVIMNLIDTMPLAYAKRVVATAHEHLPHLLLGAEPAVWKGRRMGNLVLAGSAQPLPVGTLVRQGAGGAFPWRVLAEKELLSWAAGAPALTDASTQMSPRIQGTHLAL